MRFQSLHFYTHIVFVALLTLLLAGCTVVRGAESTDVPITSNPQVAPPAPESAPPLAQQATLPGKFLFGRNGGIWMLQGNSATQIQMKPGIYYTQPALSPDGSSIVAVELGMNHSDLVLVTANGLSIKNITSYRNQYHHLQSSWAMFPAWSPDGKNIAYISDSRTTPPGRFMQLFVITTDGTQARRSPYYFDRLAAMETPRWSPISNTIMLTGWQWQTGPGQIYTVDLTSGVFTQLTTSEQGVYDGAWSPDGKRIAYVQRNGTKHDIWVMDADGKNQLQVTTNGLNRQPLWINDRTLAYLTVGAVGANIWSVTLEDRDGGLVAAKPQQHTMFTSSKDAIDSSGGLSWIQSR